MKKVAIIQGGSWGDNLNSTLMLPPLKTAYPGCEITVHTSHRYASAFVNNSLIDKITCYHTGSAHESVCLAKSLEEPVREMGYDLIINRHPFFDRDMWESPDEERYPGNNLIYTWISELYRLGLPTEDLCSQLRLQEQEIDRAESYISNRIGDDKFVLMEPEGLSGQTYWQYSHTITVGSALCRNGYNVCIASRSMRGDIAALIGKYPGRAHWAGALSIRECAHVFNHASGFVGVSSGISNACCSDYCARGVPWVEVVTDKQCCTMPLRPENKTVLTDSNPKQIAEEVIRQLDS